MRRLLDIKDGIIILISHPSIVDKYAQKDYPGALNLLRELHKNESNMKIRTYFSLGVSMFAMRLNHYNIATAFVEHGLNSNIDCLATDYLRKIGVMLDDRETYGSLLERSVELAFDTVPPRVWDVFRLNRKRLEFRQTLKSEFDGLLDRVEREARTYNLKAIGL